MKRLVATLALLGVLGSSLPQTQAQDYYGGGYPVQQEQYPILKKVLVGGALFGAGFLAGRLTAPKPHYGGYSYQGGYGGNGGYYPQQGHGNGHGQHGYGRSINFQPGQFRYGH